MHPSLSHTLSLSKQSSHEDLTFPFIPALARTQDYDSSRLKFACASLLSYYNDLCCPTCGTISYSLFHAFDILYFRVQYAHSFLFIIRLLFPSFLSISLSGNAVRLRRTERKRTSKGQREDRALLGCQSDQKKKKRRLD